jgi:hypothetical protein
MTLGTALFASVVLVLAVYHKGFRKVFFWIAGISAISAGVFFLSVYLHDKYVVAREAKRKAAMDRKVNACMARFPNPYIRPNGDRPDMWDIADACMKNPDLTPEQDMANVSASQTCTEWDVNGRCVSPNNQRIIEIYGGETLKSVRLSNTPAGAVPIIYLGHKQKFVLTCGNFGEAVAGPIVLIKSGDVSCP